MWNKHYGLNVVSGNVSSDYIMANLSGQTPMICSMAPGDFTKTGHFIVLTGIDANGKIDTSAVNENLVLNSGILVDSNCDGTNDTLSPRYTKFEQA